MTFEEFAAMRMPAVLRFAAVLAGDRAIAEDLAQEVLIRAYSRWDKIGYLDHPEFYVRKMILNEFLSWRRGSSREIPVGGAAAESASTAPDHAVAYTERDALLAELGKLPRRQRDIHRTPDPAGHGADRVHRGVAGRQQARDLDIRAARPRR
jgi:DNA-directed RNA polymerase specialized sigma24 family protein